MNVWVQELKASKLSSAYGMGDVYPVRPCFLRGSLRFKGNAKQTNETPRPKNSNNQGGLEERRAAWVSSSHVR